MSTCVTWCFPLGDRFMQTTGQKPPTLPYPCVWRKKKVKVTEEIKGIFQVRGERGRTSTPPPIWRPGRFIWSNKIWKRTFLKLSQFSNMNSEVKRMKLYENFQFITFRPVSCLCSVIGEGMLDRGERGSFTFCPMWNPQITWETFGRIYCM